MSAPAPDILRDVSRETQQRLEVYAALLKRWNPTINLIAPSTLDNLWIRHIVDSIGIYEAIQPASGAIADLGSGGGLPGLVMAALAAEAGDITVTLVESDGRKAVFCRTAAREMGLKVTVVDQRIEEAAPLAAKIVTARALAPLPKLLGYVARHLAPGGIAVLPKGAEYEKELDQARDTWDFNVEVRPSLSDPKSAVLRIGDLIRA